jgi:hypothetical protein
MTNSAGIENEVEILKSRILAHDAVMDLKLYVQYYSFGRLSKHLMYNAQPICVDVDSMSLAQWDKGLLEGAKSISLTITRRNQQYEVEGETIYNGEPTGTFYQKLKSTASQHPNRLWRVGVHQEWYKENGGRYQLYGKGLDSDDSGYWLCQGY